MTLKESRDPVEAAQEILSPGRLAIFEFWYIERLNEREIACLCGLSVEQARREIRLVRIIMSKVSDIDDIAEEVAKNVQT